MPNIQTRREPRRGCGYRKKGGFYLVADGRGYNCEAFPIPLHPCPTCGHTVSQVRSFQWISTKLLLRKQCGAKKDHCNACPILAYQELDQIGLMWVGKKFYPTPESFLHEAKKQGISKRIAIELFPDKFKIGESWLALAHPEAVTMIDDAGEEFPGPGLFMIFQPKAIEYVVKPGDSEERLKELEERGFILVNVITPEDDKKDQRSLF